MSDNSFKPGDSVVELAALVQSVAIHTGAVAGAFAGWTAKPSWIAAAVGLFTGGMLGLPVGWFVARCSYRTRNG